MPDRGRAIILVVLALLGAACPKTDTGPVLLGGQKVAAADIDKDPLALLPSGALLVGKLDAASMFRSASGTQMAKIVSRLLPLGGESDFVPQRDVRLIYAAVYAMQGADFCAILQGDFKLDAIRNAARSEAKTPFGATVVTTRYADTEMYTVGNVGVVLLTKHTLLTGNEIGMRRALDRLRYGRTKHGLPDWTRNVLSEPAASFALVGDVDRQAAVAVMADRIPFLKDMTMARVLGNFQAPGMNVVGTLSYRDAVAAARGAQGLGQLQQIAYFASFMATIGFGASMPSLQVDTRQSDVSFASQVDGTTINMLLSLLAQAIQPKATGLWPGG